MNIADITVQNFRSYAKSSFVFSPNTSIIVGPNTSGKTNILEAIMMMATGKSFRADRESEVIEWGKEVARITCRVQEGETKKLELVITAGFVQGSRAPVKKYTVNDVARRMIEFVGQLRAVLFWPEDMELVTGSPSLRRKYLDTVLVQTDREYRRSLLSYERGLRQRNRLLGSINEGKADRRQLTFWNQLLIRTGSYLTQARMGLLDFVNRQTIGGAHYVCQYDKSVISESRLDQYKEEEVAAKATLVGPHRDDFFIKEIRKEGAMELSRYGSRGEQRLAVLWLKLAELAYIEESTGERPLLLLDDIFSELDAEHRETVIQLVNHQQTIITSAETEVLSMLKKAHIPLEIISLSLIHS
ncbi:DNA replication and repair protein RecF [Candidatus Gottesmanbacteria bacterium]|nr:DNA replication and repair protein RecF [Candidatus Gottesmanbacteria bacterium]